jgi:hypothetical protein
MTDYAAVLTAEYPGREWSLNGNDYATLVMHDDGPKPTKATLDSKWAAVELARNTKAVQQARRARYFDETDDLFWEAMRTDGNLNAWKAAVAKIKTDLPKPGAAK